MNGETKRHIDAARQVLVGVVPNPTSQIDQITNALIYKFMDDMDQAAIKAGGEPSFFVSDLERYAWTRLMDARIGNQERMNLYSEALVKFSEANQLPELFRSIFRSAFLPYRSPEVLGLFLKEIDYFDYSHSEELGNAYEYLLSIMSSQGDAGQFRTPRHIIDFIVEVVNPTKDDKILDPACGTGGFLISSYRHILKQHDGKNPDGTENNEKPLTPDERRNLMSNFEGYDIDPGMARIAQVNMYLHQFKNPKIYQYDALSNDERWNDKFDVILANPPFMSPKGGSKPHSKFSIQSSRSEVLFVDFIMNHLRPKGRAGIIVPEGIIFQAGTAHKQLRRNLIEDGLYAVVSLPSGVFQPYSGVKTSILLFDNGLAKLRNEVLFVDIKDTGVSLGATRTPIEKNDLKPAAQIIKNFTVGQIIEPTRLAFVASKDEISENNYDLSSSKYRKKTTNDASKSFVALSEVCIISKGKSSSTKTEPGAYPLVLTAEEFKTADHYDFDGEGVCVPLISATGHGKASIKRVHYVKGKFALANLLAYVTPKDRGIIDSKYLFHCLDSSKDDMAKLMKGAANVSMKVTDLERYQIPVFPIEIQRQLVEELDSYQNIISGASQVANNWKPRIEVDPEWEQVEIGSLCQLINGKAFKPSDWEKKESGGLPIVRIQNLNNPKSDYNYFTGKVDDRIIINNGDLLFSWSGSRGSSFGPHIWKGEKAILNQHIFKVIHNDNVLRDFFYFVLKQAVKEVEENLHGGVGLVHITKGNLEKIKVPLPPLETQKAIVEQINGESDLVEANRKLIEIYDQKMKEAVSKIWSD